MRNKFISMLLVMCMLFSFAAIASAEGETTITENKEITTADAATDVPVMLTAEAAKFSVTVPTSLPVTVDANGNVTYAKNARIINNSSGMVKVTNVQISGKNHWNVIAWDGYDTATEKVNSMRVAFRFGTNGTDYDKTTGTDTMTFTQSYWPVMAAMNDSNTDELPIKYEAKVAAQNRIHDNAEMAQVVFTVAWDNV